MLRRAITLTVLALVACGQGINEGDVNLVPLRVEWQLGERLSADLARQLPLLEGTAEHRRIEALGQGLLAETASERPWTFHLVDAPEVNAFAVPGGHVYVAAGLLRAVEGDEELAAVLAHEIAHGLARHGTERMTKVYGIGLITAVALGRDPGILEQIAARLAGEGTFAKFSRDDEREADSLGIELLRAAGHDPMAMVALLTTLLELQERQPNRVSQFFSTHPLTERRIEDAVVLARETATP